jgi:hypothetical protein
MRVRSMRDRRDRCRITIMHGSREPGMHERVEYHAGQISVARMRRDEFPASRAVLPLNDSRPFRWSNGFAMIMVATRHDPWRGPASPCWSDQPDGKGFLLLVAHKRQKIISSASPFRPIATLIPLHQYAKMKHSRRSEIEHQQDE